MSNIVNLYAETGANFIGDDSTATFTFENSSSGETLKLQNAGGTGNQLAAVSCPTTSVFVTSASARAGHFRSGASATDIVLIEKTVCSSSTIAAIKVSVSGASAPALHFAGTCVQSTASATASLIAGIRVQFTDPAGLVRQGWIPVAVNIA